VEIFFAKLCINLVKGRWGLNCFKVLLLSSKSFIPYYLRGWGEVYTKRRMVMVGGYS